MTGTDDAIRRAEQVDHWSRVAPRWWQWRRLMETASRPVSERLVELAGIASGDRVLDVATGFGEPAVTAARRVGLTGRVVATDLSAQMLGLAHQRAAEENLANMYCVRMDGAAPCFSPASFHAVLCRWGLMALGEPRQALGELRKLLVPGGVTAVAVWGPPEKVPSIALSVSVARAVLGMDPPRAGERGPFRLADSGRLVADFTAAGYADVTVSAVTVRYAFDSVDDFTGYAKGASSPLTSLLADVDEATREVIWQKVREQAARHADGQGRIGLDNQAVCVAGVNP